jgi:hypothetical protein
VSQAFPATGPGGCDRPSCAAGCRGEEEGEKGREEGSGPARGRGPETPWKSSVVGRRGMDSRGSRRRKRLTTMMTMKTMTKMTIWLPTLASARV